MAHDIFVSYSTRDKLFVDALVHRLEKAGYRCWYAPRDIAAGLAWPEAISRAIREIPLMLLVFSEASNSSEEISRELTLASNNKRVVLPVRIENVLPGTALEYHLADRHWLDVYSLESEAAATCVLEGVRRYAHLFDEQAPGQTPPPVNAGPATTDEPAAPGIQAAAKFPLKRLLPVALLLALLVTAGAFFLRESPVPVDPATAALDIFEPPYQVSYVSRSGLPIAAHAVRLTPRPDSPLPQYLVTLTGMGGPFDGRIFHCPQTAYNNTFRFTPTIDNRPYTLLIVDHLGRGTAYQPGSTQEYPVVASALGKDPARARRMLDLYRQGKHWTENAR